VVILGVAEIAVVGSGYLGLVVGICFADLGNNVIINDIDREKITELNDGKLPIYESGLKEIFERVRKGGQLVFTTDYKYTVENSEYIFILVDTPSREDGKADLKNILNVARSIGRKINGYKIIVIKSTVPVGTGYLVKDIIREEMLKQGLNHPFDVVSNPEFMREGEAVNDFFSPSRFVIGSENEKVLQKLLDVYRDHLNREIPFLFTNIETAEMIKYASNAFLATKISFINEIARFCAQLNVDVRDVARGMGMDERISPHFLQAGCGYGGSCLPKDNQALAQMGRDHGFPLDIVEAVIKVNERQKKYMVKIIEEKMGNLEGKILGVLGLSFKPGTGDMREAPSLSIIPSLIEKGAYIQAFCPGGKKEAIWRLEKYKGKIEFLQGPYEAIERSSACVLLTEWDQFRDLDFFKVKKLLKDPFFFDFRNLYSRSQVEEVGPI